MTSQSDLFTYHGEQSIENGVSLIDFEFFCRTQSYDI